MRCASKPVGSSMGGSLPKQIEFCFLLHIPVKSIVFHTYSQSLLRRPCVLLAGCYYNKLRDNFRIGSEADDDEQKLNAGNQRRNFESISYQPFPAHRPLSKPDSQTPFTSYHDRNGTNVQVEMLKGCNHQKKAPRLVWTDRQTGAVRQISRQMCDRCAQMV